MTPVAEVELDLLRTCFAEAAMTGPPAEVDALRHAHGIPARDGAVWTDHEAGDLVAVLRVLRPELLSRVASLLDTLVDDNVVEMPPRLTLVS